MQSKEEHQIVFDYTKTVLGPLYKEYTETTGQKSEMFASCQAEAYSAMAGGNVAEAMAQIVEACLQVSIALDAHLVREAESMLADKECIKWCAVAPREQVSNKIKEANRLHAIAIESKKKNAITSSIEDKKEIVEDFIAASRAYKEWFLLFDKELIEDFPKFKLRSRWKDHGIGFISGIATSAIVTVAAALVPSNGSSNLQAQPGHAASAAASAATR